MLRDDDGDFCFPECTVSADFVKAIAMGADAVAVATAGRV